jgi:NADH-quinone oxidoreductase subunit E
VAQREYGHLTDEAIQEVADILDMTPTQVRTVVGFYTLFYTEPIGKHLIQICDDLPCALRGSGELVEHACKKLGIRPGETTEDGLFTLETVVCIAACDRAPVMQVDLEYFENLTAEQFDEIVERLRSESEFSDIIN